METAYAGDTGSCHGEAPAQPNQAIQNPAHQQRKHHERTDRRPRSRGATCSPVAPLRLVQNGPAPPRPREHPLSAPAPLRWWWTRATTSA